MLLNLHILSPLKDLFTGEVLSVSSRNSAGPFDVLQDHANFITIIDGAPIFVRLSNGTKQEFKFPVAVLHCQNNQVKIFVDLAAAETALVPALQH